MDLDAVVALPPPSDFLKPSLAEKDSSNHDAGGSQSSESNGSTVTSPPHVEDLSAASKDITMEDIVSSSLEVLPGSTRASFSTETRYCRCASHSNSSPDAVEGVLEEQWHSSKPVHGEGLRDGAEASTVAAVLDLEGLKLTWRVNGTLDIESTVKGSNWTISYTPVHSKAREAQKGNKVEFISKPVLGTVLVIILFVMNNFLLIYCTFFVYPRHNARQLPSSL